MSVSEVSYTLPFEKLSKATDSLSAEFKAGSPWPHIVIDDFFEEKVLDTILDEFKQSSANWKTFDSKYEGKNQMNSDESFGPMTRSVFHALNSAPFIEYVSKVTGIERLVPDPYLVGGGYHEIPRGGKLGVHVDFNQHKVLGLYRRLNVIIYLNKEWEEEYGGHFQLWDRESGKCEKKVLPIFNRMAIFETTTTSFHGHPEPLNCPDDIFRRSLALYYYSPDRGGQSKKSHSTIFLTQDGKLDDLGGRPTFISRVIKKVFGDNSDD